MPLHGDAQRKKSPAGISRRTVLGSLAAGAVASAMKTRVSAAQSPAGAANTRGADAFRLRLEAARFEQRLGEAPHHDNGDEERFQRRFANYSKGLPHNAAGEVDAGAYESLLRAVSSGDSADFERVQLGGSMLLINPLAGLAFDLHGPDSHALGMRPAPAFDSAEEAAEIAENYWMALARDVPFNEYGGHPLIEGAAADLTRMQDFRGPREGSRISASTLFRGTAPGATSGPYISQFLWKRTPFGAEEVDRRIHTARPGLDYLTNYPEWLSSQSGAAPAASFGRDTERR
jgi:hypothetical protein